MEVYIRHMRQVLKSYFVVLDTGPGFSFLMAAFVPAELLHLVWPIKDNTSVRDTGSRISTIGDTITLVIKTWIQAS